MNEQLQTTVERNDSPNLCEKKCPKKKLARMSQDRDLLKGYSSGFVIPNKTI